MRPTLSLLQALSQPFKRSQDGLFHGKMKIYGNNVPFSKHKTRRTWMPNMHRKVLQSEVMGPLRLKVTTLALKTMKKVGGLDNYLLRTHADKLGDRGVALRVRLRESMKIKEENEKVERANLRLYRLNKAIEKGKALPPYPERPTVADAQKERHRVGELLGVDKPASSRKTLEFRRREAQLLEEYTSP